MATETFYVMPVTGNDHNCAFHVVGLRFAEYFANLDDQRIATLPVNDPALQLLQHVARTHYQDSNLTLQELRDVLKMHEKEPLVIEAIMGPLLRSYTIKLLTALKNVNASNASFEERHQKIKKIKKIKEIIDGRHIDLDEAVRGTRGINLTDNSVLAVLTYALGMNYYLYEPESDKKLKLIDNLNHIPGAPIVNVLYLPGREHYELLTTSQEEQTKHLRGTPVSDTDMSLDERRIKAEEFLIQKNNDYSFYYKHVEENGLREKASKLVSYFGADLRKVRLSNSRSTEAAAAPLSSPPTNPQIASANGMTLGTLDDLKLKFRHIAYDGIGSGFQIETGTETSTSFVAVKDKDTANEIKLVVSPSQIEVKACPNDEDKYKELIKDLLVVVGKNAVITIDSRSPQLPKVRSAIAAIKALDNTVDIEIKYPNVTATSSVAANGSCGAETSIENAINNTNQRVSRLGA